MSKACLPHTHPTQRARQKDFGSMRSLLGVDSERAGEDRSRLAPPVATAVRRCKLSRRCRHVRVRLGDAYVATHQFVGDSWSGADGFWRAALPGWMGGQPPTKPDWQARSTVGCETAAPTPDRSGDSGRGSAPYGSRACLYPLRNRWSTSGIACALQDRALKVAWAVRAIARHHRRPHEPASRHRELCRLHLLRVRVTELHRCRDRRSNQGAEGGVSVCLVSFATRFAKPPSSLLCRAHHELCTRLGSLTAQSERVTAHLARRG